jgi:hypothetical protein
MLMNWFLLLKLLAVFFFLVMFLRGSRLVWGVGLLTVTTAVLLDTILGTFDRDRLLAEIGFFYHVLSGALFGGAAVWVWGVLRPLTTAPDWGADRLPQPNGRRRERSTSARPVGAARAPAPAKAEGTIFDRQMLYDQIRYRFSPDDVFDLIFDLGINENDVFGVDRDMRQVILNVMDLAEERGESSALALAVERILTPLPPEQLPRLEKLNPDSPHTVLRQFLLAHYSQQQLEQMAERLGVDWEQLEGLSKKAKVRALLLYLYRRNRVDELIAFMQGQEPASA